MNLPYDIAGRTALLVSILGWFYSLLRASSDVPHSWILYLSGVSSALLASLLYAALLGYIGLAFLAFSRNLDRSLFYSITLRFCIFIKTAPCG